MPNPELLIVISAQDAASNVVKGVEKALQDFREQNKVEAAERKAIRDKETAEYKASAEFRRKVMRQEIFDMQMMASNMQSMGMSMTIMGAAGVAAFVGVAKAAIDWETAFTGVRKTVEMTDTEAKGLQDTLRSMALRIPVDTTELAKIMQIAGQLGVRGSANLEKFTETISRMAVSTDMTAEVAATAMARIANVMQMPLTNIDRMGASIVALGNQFAATESEITLMSQRISGAGKVVGMTVPDILGLATALSAVGVRAELGGSAISRAMIEIADSVASGNEKLALFAAVAGMTVDEFVKQWKTAPAQALASFIDGLGQVTETGGNTFKLIDDLGLGEIRLRDATLRLSGAQGELDRALSISNVSWDANSALIEESERRFKTLQSQITLAMNAFKDIAITMGESVTPQMQGATQAIRNMALAVGVFAKEHPTLASAATLMVGLGGATTLAGGILLIFTGRALQAVASMRQLALMSSGLPLALRLVAQGMMGVTGALFGPAGLIAGLALGAHWIATTTLEAQLAKRPVEDLEKQTLDLDYAMTQIGISGPEAAYGISLYANAIEDAKEKARDFQIGRILEADPSMAGFSELMKDMSKEQRDLLLAGAKLTAETPPSLPKPPPLPDFGGGGAGDAAGAAKKLEDARASARKQIAAMALDLAGLTKRMNEETNAQDLQALSLEELTSLQSQAQAIVGTSYEGAQVSINRAREAILNYNALVSSGTATVDSLAAAEDAVRFAVDNARFSTQLYSDELKGLGDITDAVKSKTKELADIAAKEAAVAAEKAAEAIRLWNEQLERNNNLMAQISGRQLGGLGEQRATQTQMITDAGKQLLAVLRETGLTGEELRARMEGYGFAQEAVNEIMGITSEKAQGMIAWVKSLNLGLEDEKLLLESMLPAYFGLTAAQEAAAAAQEELNQTVRDYQFELQKAADLQRTVYGPAAAATEMGQAQFAYASIMGAINRGMSPQEAVAQFRKDQPLLGKTVDIITTGPGLETYPGFTGPRPRVPGFQLGGIMPGTPSQASLAVVHGREAIIPGDKLDAMIGLLEIIAGKPVIDGPGFAQSVSAYMQARSSSLSRMGA